MICGWLQPEEISSNWLQVRGGCGDVEADAAVKFLDARGSIRATDGIRNCGLNAIESANVDWTRKVARGIVNSDKVKLAEISPTSQKDGEPMGSTSSAASVIKWVSTTTTSQSQDEIKQGSTA